MSDNPFGQIQLNGNPFRIDVNSYQVHDLSDYSPKASVPGNSIVYSELMTYQPLTQNDWTHGFGFHWYEDASGYLTTSGRIDTSHNNIVIPFTKDYEDAWDSSQEYKAGYAQFGNHLCAYGGSVGRAYDYNAGIWKDITCGGSNSNPQFALATQDYVFYSPINGRLLKVDSTLVGGSAAGANVNSKDYHWLCVHNGFVYAGVRNTNRVHYATQPDLSDLYGTIADDPAYILVGGDSYYTVNAISFANNLYIAKKNGLWVLGDDKIARRVLDFSHELSANNFVSMIVHNSYLVFTIQNKIYQWSGSRLVDISPQRITDDYPYNMLRYFKGFVTRGKWLYCLGFNSTETTTTVALLKYDGVSWHMLVSDLASEIYNDGVSQGAYAMTIYSIELDPYSDGYIVYNFAYAHMGSQYYSTKRIQLGDGEYPHYSTKLSVPNTTDNSITTSRLDMGFRNVKKSLSSLLIEAYNVDTTTYIQVYYSIDNSAWVYWGDVNDSNIELTSPGGNRTIEFYQIKFKFAFVTNDADGVINTVPVLEGYTVRFMLRPEVFYGYNFNIVASSNYINGMFQDNRSAKDIIDQLHTARDSKAPIEFYDIHNTQRYGYISSLTERAIEESETEDGITDVEHLVNVNFVEVR